MINNKLVKQNIFKKNMNHMADLCIFTQEGRHFGLITV